MPRIRAFFDFIIAEIDSVRAVLTAATEIAFDHSVHH
jgi:hypothetical protein